MGGLLPDCDDVNHHDQHAHGATTVQGSTHTGVNRGGCVGGCGSVQCELCEVEEAKVQEESGGGGGVEPVEDCVSRQNASTPPSSIYPSSPPT